MKSQRLNGLERMTHAGARTHFCRGVKFGVPAYVESTALDGSKASGGYTLGIAGPGSIVGWADIGDMEG